MKNLGDVLIGLLVLIFVLILIGFFIALIGSLIYWFGWCVGWITHLMVGPDIIFGMAFEDFFGIFFLIVGLIGVGRTAVNQEEVKKKVDEGIKKGLKEYRGY